MSTARDESARAWAMSAGFQGTGPIEDSMRTMEEHDGRQGRQERQRKGPEAERKQAEEKGENQGRETAQEQGLSKGATKGFHVVRHSFSGAWHPPRALRTTSFESGLPGPGSPPHRPAVAFGARRASAPARRPAVACGVRSPRSITATSGRLDGLLGGRDALFRVAKPEDCHPRECAHRSEERTRHILKEWHVPPVRDVTCLSEARVCRAGGSVCTCGPGIDHAKGSDVWIWPWGSKRAGGWPRSTRSSWRDAAAGGGVGDKPR
jgi:hypothetical protein